MLSIWTSPKVFHLLTLYQTTKFRLAKTGSFHRRQNKCDLKFQYALARIENIVEKGENAAFSPFPTMFSEGIFFQGH